MACSIWAFGFGFYKSGRQLTNYRFAKVQQTFGIDISSSVENGFKFVLLVAAFQGKKQII